jgi:hypothetical protein
VPAGEGHQGTTLTDTSFPAFTHSFFDKHPLTASCVATTNDSTAGYLVNIAHPSISVAFTIANSPAST